MANRSTSHGKIPRYQTYLVTCWQERDEVASNITWRFRLETTHTGQRRLFTALEEVMSAIEIELNDNPGGD